MDYLFLVEEGETLQDALDEYFGLVDCETVFLFGEETQQSAALQVFHNKFVGVISLEHTLEGHHIVMFRFFEDLCLIQKTLEPSVALSELVLGEHLHGQSLAVF